MTLSEARSCEPPLSLRPTRAPRGTTCDTAPAKPPTPQRYTISEVATRSGLTTHTLRWYERIGLMPHIDRSYSGQRHFTAGDLAWLELVGKLRTTGMSVADMVRYAELVRAGDHTVAERLELLSRTRQETRRKIDDLNEALATLDYKIDLYSDACRVSEQESAL